MKELEKYYVKNTDGGAHPAWLDDVKGKELVKGGQTSLEEVVKGMIHYSSNANASYLLDKLGAARINESLKELGLNSHDEFYPTYTGALYMRGYVEKNCIFLKIKHWTSYVICLMMNMLSMYGKYMNG